MINNISVVTICFNNLDDLKKTCTSVDIQKTLPFEHLIIDGSITSEIKIWLEDNSQPSYRKWICERDKGIADAFNKGIQNSTGDIIYLLNSGDIIYDETVLKKVKGEFEQKKNITWLNGKMNVYRADTWAITGKPFEKDKLYRGMHGVFHPTMYVKREVYDRRGVFDLDIKYAMDYDFLCRLIDEESGFIDYPLATFDPNGQSTQSYLATTREMFKCYQKYYGKGVKQTLWNFRLILLHHLLNSSLGKFLYRMKVKMRLQKV